MYHLKRVMGNALLTFVELYGLLTQIEAILNSRSFSPLSSYPLDLSQISMWLIYLNHGYQFIKDYNTNSTFGRDGQRSSFQNCWTCVLKFAGNQRVVWIEVAEKRLVLLLPVDACTRSNVAFLCFLHNK